jgi:hypothetical protein
MDKLLCFLSIEMFLALCSPDLLTYDVFGTPVYSVANHIVKSNACLFIVLSRLHVFLNVYTILLYARIPGQLNDRRTMLGELNWIFTAITDTIAWNTLPRG